MASEVTMRVWVPAWAELVAVAAATELSATEAVLAAKVSAVFIPVIRLWRLVRAEERALYALTWLCIFVF